MSTPDAIRTAVRRLLAAREAESAAREAQTAANVAFNTAQVEATAAARDLAFQTGAAAFALEGRIVIVQPGSMASVAPTVTVLPLSDLTQLEPLRPASEPPVAPVQPAPVPKPVVPLSGGKVPDSVKGAKK